MNKKEPRGGARKGAGRKTAEEMGIEKRKQYPLMALPSLMEAFKELHGRGWSLRVQELIKEDLVSRQAH
jgi:hypothetical protein